MPWYLPIPESWKKRACRYLLQRYVGHFLKEKLSLDQLSVDLFSGRGIIKDLNLDVEALNDSLESVNAPIEIIDGFIGSISMAIPWSSLLAESMEVEINRLELTIQLKECDDETDMFLNTASMFSSMTSSLQLAEEVIRSDKSATDNSPSSEPFEGVQMFAQTIESVLSRVKLSLKDTIIRLEHLPNEAGKGIALEMRIDRIDYFDDLAKETGSPVDGDDVDGGIHSLAAEAMKNLHLMGVSLYCDEYCASAKTNKVPTMDDSLDISSKLYESAMSSISTTETLEYQDSPSRRDSTSEPSLSTPIKLAVLTGQQVLKVKIKQNDSLSGPKMDVDCQLGAIHVLLSPWQVHGILQLLNGITSSGSSGGSHSQKKSTRNKMMDSTDFQRVEHELQKELQTGRLNPPLAEPQVNYFASPDNMLHSIGDLNDDGSEDLYFSMHGNKSHGMSEMDISSSSINTTSTCNRSSSTATTCQQSDSSQTTRRKSIPKSTKDNLQKLLDDPSAEISHYRMKISFLSFCVLHENPSVTPKDCETQEVTATDKLREISDNFFSKVAAITFAGVNKPMKVLREEFSKILPFDHLGLLGKPLTVDCTQKVAPRHKTMSVDLIVGSAELVECLYDRKINSSPLHTTTGPKLAHYSELLTFTQNDLSSSPFNTNLHETVPAVKLHFVSGERTKSSHRRRSQDDPQAKLNVEFGQLQCEIDVTIVDRITSLLNSDNSTNPVDSKTTSYYGQQNKSMLFTEAMDEESRDDEKLDILVSSQSATLHIRFPKPDLRQSTERLPWWERNLHKEILILELRNFRFLTQLCNSNKSSKLEFTCSDVLGFFQEDSMVPPILVASITSDDNCDNIEKQEGFNWPRLVITSYQVSSQLQTDEQDSIDTTTLDSLNGICQFAKKQSSPFSNKKFMFQQEDLSSVSQPEVKHTCEELVLPGNKEELKEFQEKSSNNTKLLVEIVLPSVVAVLHSKHFFEVLYNRVNNDLLLWEPMAPSPLNTQDKSNLYQPLNLNVLNLLQDGGKDLFHMAQSGIHYNTDSASDDEDDSINYYSIHEKGHRKRSTQEHELQSKMCLSLTIGHGKVLANIPHKDDKKHGELLVVINDAVLFSVASHNGDPHLRYLCFQANKFDLNHNGCVDGPIMSGESAIDCIKAEQNRILNHCVGRSERGVPSKLAGQVGRGPDSMDMLSVAVKTTLDTINNVKDFTVSVCVKGGTLHHRMVESGESWISQALDLLDVKDYPILGYIEPEVVTQLHVHLWSCAIDYRPLYLPLRAMLTAEAFSISSNIVTGSPTSLLRFQLDDAALYLSDKQFMEVNIKDEYVCVADLERLELSLKSSDGKNQKYPKTDLRLNTNRINIRTCSDSCRALADIIVYFASDGDLKPEVNEQEESLIDDEDSYKDDDTCSLTSDISECSSIPQETNQMTESCLQKVNCMMADAMRESSSSTSGSGSPERQKPSRELYFVPDDEESSDDFYSEGIPQSSGLQEITVSPSSDSMTSSMYSDKTEKFSDDEEFCIIDDAGWGISSKDGQPAIRILSKEPIVIKDNYISQPLGKTDLLKAPDYFPPADYRYTLKELTLIWYMYGGKDFGTAGRSSKGRERNYSGDSPKPKRFNLPDFGKCLSKEEIPVKKRPSWQTRGGPGRDCDTLMELQLSKVRFQYDIYPQHTEQASRQVLVIHELEIRDRLASSQINKFLYQYTSENIPRQTNANMVLIKALHTRPDPKLHSQECALKISLLPLRLNIDQDSLFFLRNFFMELTGQKASNPYEVSSGKEKSSPSNPKNMSSVTPPPVMGVNKSQEDETEPEPDEQVLLIKFEEQDAALQAKLSVETIDSTQTESQPVFFKTLIFSPDVPIRLDYHGKRVDMQQGTLAGLLVGLAQLNSSELKLRRLNYKHGLLGFDRVIAYIAHEWLTDIRKNQLPSILGGVGPMHSFVQIVHGIKDLFWLPVEQYKKDGRIVRGIQRGASSFTTSTAMALLELTNKLVLSIQYVAELTYDMLSPGPSVRQPNKYKKKYMYQRIRKGQPTDLREGVNNAYIVLKEGFGDAAHNLVRAATEEQEQKGLTGVVGGVLRQIPPTIVQPVIIASEATSKVLGGMRNQLRPEAKKEDEEKWREENK